MCNSRRVIIKQNKLIMAVDPEALAGTRDIVYVICTLIQTIVGLLIGYFWDKRKRKKDRLRDERQREANRLRDERKREEDRLRVEEHRAQDRQRNERQREEDRLRDKRKRDADNLAAVLGQMFDEVERIFDRFDKKVVKLGEKKITDRFSEHDVLVYMCHPDNQETFATPSQSSHNTWHGMEMGMLDAAGNQGMLAAPNHSDGTSTYGIKQVMSDVDSIMKLFLQFRLTLSSIRNETCPEDIKDEFSSEIKKMGEAIYPFVSVSRQKVITLALKYFDQQLTHADEQERGTRQSEIKNEIPYIEFSQYEDGNMDCNIPCKKLNLVNLEQHVRQGQKKIMAKKDEIQREILTVLGAQQEATQITGDQEYLLHLIRIVRLKIRENELDNNKLNAFIEYVKKIDCNLVSTKAGIIKASKWEVENIQFCISFLEGNEEILGHKDTPNFLKAIADDIRKLGQKKVQYT